MALKKFCKHCNNLTSSSPEKIINKRKFFVCLKCGNPYDYKNYQEIVKVTTKKYKSRGNSQVNKYGKAGKSKDTYTLYLQTDHWKSLRKKKLNKNPTCEICGNEASEVHHTKYTDEKGSILYREDLNVLKSLCRDCHRETHSI